MEITIPYPAGREFQFYWKTFEGTYKAGGLSSLLCGVEKDLDRICEKRLLSEEVSFLAYVMNVQDRTDLICCVDGGCCLSLESPSREFLVRDFQRRYKEEFKKGLAKMGLNKDYDLKGSFLVYGYGDVVRRIVGDIDLR